MISFKIKIDGLYGIAERFGRFRQEFLPIIKAEIADGCDPYVPAKDDALSASVRQSVSSPDEFLVYAAKYAKAQYYGYPNKGTDVHPQASMQWFEKWKASASVETAVAAALRRVRF